MSLNTKSENAVGPKMTRGPTAQSEGVSWVSRGVRGGAGFELALVSESELGRGSEQGCHAAM